MTNDYIAKLGSCYAAHLAAYTRKARNMDNDTLAIALREAWRPVLEGCSGPRHDAEIFAYERIAAERGVSPAPMHG